MDMNSRSLDFMALMWKQQMTAGRMNPYTQAKELQGASFGSVAIQTLQEHQAAEAVTSQSVSLEERLKARYPGLVYHVFDGSSSYWRYRNDYPHYLLHQENIDTEALENWEPKGPNPVYAESPAIRALGGIRPGSKAVVIHPKVQERMEREPEYADEIMARIEAWFTFDVARNEAMMPGSTEGMSQSIVIGEDGNIANACSSTPGRITYSGSGADDEEDFWAARLKRHAFYMEQWKESQMEHSLQVSSQFTVLSAKQAAKARLKAMINGGELRAALGDKICGMPTGELLTLAMQQVEQGLG